MGAKGEQSNIVLTDIEYKYGYPVINGEQIIVYSPTLMKLEANGEKINSIPALAELYNKYKNKAA